MTKFIFRITLIPAALILSFLAIYAVYIFLSYERIPDNVSIVPQGNFLDCKIQRNTQYRITSANLGFGAYSQDFSFFMDGGKYSWAYSRDEVIKNITGSANSIIKMNPDFMVFQEVDFDSTRSHHIDERKIIFDLLNEKSSENFNTVFAQNYDSSFLLWPLWQPHGKNKSGIIEATKFQMKDTVRRSFPIETGLSKFLDLDRCFMKTHIDVENGRQLVLYNTHMSAYTTNAETSTRQIEMLNNDMMEEYNKGNYILCGGDFNREVKENMSEHFGFKSNGLNWTKTFPKEKLDEHLSLVPPVDESNPIPTVRDTEKGWDGTNFVTVIDGFIVSDNIEVMVANAMDNNFEFSDHNPIYMDFKLK